MKNQNQCESKVAYDTEFEAERAASIAGYRFQAEMEVYPCGRHWHIANKLIKLRSKNRPFNRTYCDLCEVYMKPKNWRRHATLASHIRKAYKREEAPTNADAS